MDLLPISLDADDLMTALDMMVEIQQPTMIWGPPGIGKSNIIAQLAKKLGIELKDVRAMLMNPVDVNGLPHIRFANDNADKIARLQALCAKKTVNLADVREILGTTIDDLYGETIWSRPGILPKVGRGILLFDEINAAGPDVQAALYQPILDRRIGDHLMGDGWTIVCAGNRESDKGVVYRMPTPLSDRLEHYDLRVEFGPWERWAVDHDIHPLVIAYLKLSMQKHNDDKGCGMLHRFDPKSGDRSFPTPRSWEKVSNQIKIIEDRGLNGTEIEKATIAGKVGRSAAEEMIAFAVPFREGFTIDAVMMNPDTAIVPSQPAMRCAVAASLARHATKTNVARIMDYIGRLPEEYQVMFVKNAERGDPTLATTSQFTKFKVANQEIMS